MLYFSYGSNMSHRRLKQRVPSARFVVTATLANHSLRFHKSSKDGSGKCDAFHTGDSSDQILGAVFDISTDGKSKLDRVEGLGYGYEVKQVTLLTNEQEEIEAFTYYATNINELLKPYHWYKEHVVRGCNENALPPTYTEKVSAVESIEDPNQDRAERELAIYR